MGKLRPLSTQLGTACFGGRRRTWLRCDRLCVPRLTTQCSLEDDEEAAREQRRQERDRQLQDQAQDEGSQSSEPPEQEKL